jgi:hypothetical protein
MRAGLHAVASDLLRCRTAEAAESKGDVALQRYVQILGTDAGDCCPCVLVVTESARYLFNAGDGLQVWLVRLVVRSCLRTHFMSPPQQPRACLWSAAAARCMQKT